jgi:cytochrome c oxidase subunit 2
MRKWPEYVLGFLAPLILSGAATAAVDKGKVPNPTEAWNHAWNEILIDLFAIGGIFAIAAAYLLIKYRAKAPGEVGSARPLNLDRALAWALVPAAIFMADDFYLSAKGWSLWNVQRVVPANAMEIKVTGYQWYFEFEYPGGGKATDLVVPVGKPIVLRMTSADVIHSFGLTEYRLKEDMMPGRITYLWFHPDKPLETQTVCVEFCGTSHAQMFSKVKAVPEPEFDAWLAKRRKRAALEDNRKALTAVDALPPK